MVEQQRVAAIAEAGQVDRRRVVREDFDAEPAFIGRLGADGDVEQAVRIGARCSILSVRVNCIAILARCAARMP